jgi:hypothetical protein
MDSKITNHSTCVDQFEKKYQELPPDAKADALIQFLDETCDFNSVTAGFTVDLTPENDLTTAALLRFLLNQPDTVVSNLSQFAFHKIQTVAGCKPRATNVPNLIALEDKQGTIAALYLVANNGTDNNFLMQLLYVHESDDIHIFFPLTWRYAYNELLRTLRAALLQLPEDQNGRFFLDKIFRRKIVEHLVLRDGFAPYFWNGYNHLAHYFYNYLGPLSRYLNEGVFPPGKLLLLGDRPSWFGDVELSHIIPGLDGFSKIQSHAIFVATMQDAYKICRETNLGMISLRGSEVSLALSRSISQYLENHANPARIDTSTSFQETLILGIGLRGGTRMVINLDELIFSVCERILNTWDKKIHIIFDGMCKSPNPENPTTLLLSLDQEIQQAQLLSSKLASLGVSSESVVGMRIIDQLQRLSMCSTIITHNGSGSAKYLWALNKPTIILNGPANTNIYKYNSGSDPRCHGVMGLQFGRAFRGDCHSDEYYVNTSLLRLVEAGPISDTSGTRGNSTIDVERGSTQIIEFISEILGTTLGRPN